MEKKEVTLKRIEILDYLPEKTRTSLKIAYSADNENKILITDTNHTDAEKVIAHLFEEIREQEKNSDENYDAPLAHYTIIRLTQEEEVTQKLKTFLQAHEAKTQERIPLESIKNQKIIFN